MIFFQAIWYLFAATVSIIGCTVAAKHLSENYVKNGNKFMTVFTYVAVYAILAVGAVVFLFS